ncbi:glycosyltransferase family 39 protein [Xanthobacter sediminis]
MAHDTVRDDGSRSLGTAALHGLGFLILTALMTVLIVVQQRSAGAYTAEFSATGPDESGHVVTGLMVANYISSGLPAPLAFVADYGLHFPRVVLGLWPPFYYVLEGIWLSLLEPSTPAVLLLPAVLAALLVASAGWAAAHRFGALPGVAVGAVLMVLPALREATVVVGLDLPLALLMLWAGLAYAAFLDRQRPRDGVLFALLAAAAILTKTTGLALLALPPLCVLLTGRFGLLRRRAFWLPLLLIAVIAGPWTIGTFPMVWAAGAGPGLAAPELARAVADQLGAVLAALAAAGGVFALLDARKGPPALLPVVLLLALAFAAVLTVVPPAEPAAALPLYAPLVILAAAGGLRLVGLVTSGWTTLAGLAVALVMLLAALPALMAVVAKPALGLDAVAQSFLADAGRPPVLLVVADRNGEGALVAAVAQRDPARRSFVLPARTALPAAPDGTPDELMAGLDGLGVGYLAIAGGAAAGEAARDARMAAVLAAYPERFKLLARFPGAQGDGETRLFALLPPPGAEAAPPTPMR